MHDEYIIELLAKALDEPLTPAEQARVNEALQSSVAWRIAAEGLHEFDAMLKRLGMAIPDEGFPLRVLERIEAYETFRARAQWAITLALIFAGGLAASVWLVLNWSALFASVIQWIVTALVILPQWFNALAILLQAIGRGPLVVYALLVLVLMLIWARASGGVSRHSVNR